MKCSIKHLLQDDQQMSQDTGIKVSTISILLLLPGTPVTRR